MHALSARAECARACDARPRSVAGHRAATADDALGPETRSLVASSPSCGRRICASARCLARGGRARRWTLPTEHTAARTVERRVAEPVARWSAVALELPRPRGILRVRE